MEYSQSSLKKSLGILNSCLFIVLITYVLDVIYARMVYLGMGPLAVCVTIPSKIYFFSGFFGALLEIVSGEEITLQFKNVKRNAKEYWKIVTIFMSIPSFVYFSLVFTQVTMRDITYYSVYAHLNILVLYGISLYMIRRKYLQGREVSKEKGRGGSSRLIMLGILYALYVFFFYLPYHFDVLDFDETRITGLLTNYLNLLIFILLSCESLKQYPGVENAFKRKNEIYMINPLGGGLFYHLWSMLVRKYPPVFVVLKALTPKHYHFREFNLYPWNERYYAGDKLVAITCFTSNSSDCYRIAREFRKRGSKVVIGGSHVTFVPEEALEYCDSVVVGEVESAWSDIVKDYENDSLKKIYRGVALEECHDLIQQELMNSPPEIIRDFLETSRGCKFKCRFCTVPILSGGKIRAKSIDDLVALIKQVKKKFNRIIFIDNNIYNEPAYAKELFKALKPLGIKWATQCTIDIANNDETLRLAKESGCVQLLIGFEVSENSLEKNKGGKMSMAKKYRQYVKKLKKMGISIKAHFIFGFESDNFKNIFSYWKFCFSLQPFITVMSILTPFPGTKVYEEMVREDQISNLNWQHYGSQSLVFKHKQMNNLVLAKVWPVIFLVFFLTTSRLGYVCLGLLILNVVGILY